MSATDLDPRAILASLEAVPSSLYLGCTCHWDADGNPPPDCRCEERSKAAAIARREQEVSAYFAALDYVLVTSIVAVLDPQLGLAVPVEDATRAEAIRDAHAVLAALPFPLPPTPA